MVHNTEGIILSLELSLPTLLITVLYVGPAAAIFTSGVVCEPGVNSVGNIIRPILLESSTGCKDGEGASNSSVSGFHQLFRFLFSFIDDSTGGLNDAILFISNLGASGGSDLFVEAGVVVELSILNSCGKFGKF